MEMINCIASVFEADVYDHPICIRISPNKFWHIGCFKCSNRALLVASFFSIYDGSKCHETAYSMIRKCTNIGDITVQPPCHTTDNIVYLHPNTIFSNFSVTHTSSAEREKVETVFQENLSICSTHWDSVVPQLGSVHCNIETVFTEAVHVITAATAAAIDWWWYKIQVRTQSTHSSA